MASSGEILLHKHADTLSYTIHMHGKMKLAVLLKHNTGDAFDGQNIKIIPPIWWCDPDTCEPEWDRVKYFITYFTSVFEMWVIV